ncbi:MAG: OmpH family outer membrane protein [Acetobacteraceae bacterium]|nr:OmpH family outer membrane protein [Acetobacteraceae bacterium]
MILRPRPRVLLPAALLAPLLFAQPPALAQQQQQWFVPGQGGQQGQQQRPAQQQQQRPAQQQQRPAQPNPAPLAPGQPPPAPVLGLVDVEEVQRNSTAFNQVREEIERRRARLNEDLQREQQRWREEQQALAAARATLPPEQLRARERELQERIANAQAVFRERNRNLEQAAQQGLGEIQQALGLVLQQVAASRNVNIVLPRQVVVFNMPGFDLTEQVTAQLNTVLRSVALPPETPAPAAAAPPPAAAPPARRN